MAQRACPVDQMMMMGGTASAATAGTAAAAGAAFPGDDALQQQQHASTGFPGFSAPVAPSASHLASAAGALPHDTQQHQLHLQQHQHQQNQLQAYGSGALSQPPSLQHLAIPPLHVPAPAPDNLSHMPYSHMSYSHMQPHGQELHAQPSLHAPLPSLQPQPSGTAAAGSVGGGAPATSLLPGSSQQLQTQPSGGGIRSLHRTGSGGGAMRLGSGSFRFGGAGGPTPAATRPEPSAADQPSAAHHTLRTSNHSTALPGRRGSEMGQPPLSASGAGARSGAGERLRWS